MSHRRTFRYRVVDVFTRVPLEGNALAVFPDSHGLDDDTMQRIARELNLSETVFIGEPALPDCVKSFRIFTPVREMIFAGHPTVGAAYVLLEQNSVPDGAESFQVEEKVGPVTIRVERSEPPLIWLETPPISFEQTVRPDVCASLLGLKPEHLLPIQPQMVTAGNPTLLIAVSDPSVVDCASIDSNVLAQMNRDDPRPFCVFVFAPVATGAYSRMFAPEYGIVEDPATGSSTGPLAAYMRRHQLLPKSTSRRFVSEQGTRMGRRSLLHFEFSAGDTEPVFVGGHVTPLAEAVMTI